jgi:hypothetical protein
MGGWMDGWNKKQFYGLLYSNKNISFFSGAALWTVQQK